MPRNAGGHDREFWQNKRDSTIPRRFGFFVVAGVFAGAVVLFSSAMARAKVRESEMASG